MVGRDANVDMFNLSTLISTIPDNKRFKSKYDTVDFNGPGGGGVVFLNETR